MDALPGRRSIFTPLPFGAGVRVFGVSCEDHCKYIAHCCLAGVVKEQAVQGRQITRSAEQALRDAVGISRTAKCANLTTITSASSGIRLASTSTWVNIYRLMNC